MSVKGEEADMKWPKRMNNRGFTLIELFIAMTIGVLLLAAIVSAYQSQSKTYVTQQQILSMQQGIRAAMFYLKNDLMMAGADGSQLAGAGFTTIGPSDMAFTMDITGGPVAGYDDDRDGKVDDEDDNEDKVWFDGLISDSGESIRYFLRGTTLVRDDVLGAGEQVLAENIDALNFVYLNDKGTVTSRPREVRTVQVTLVARSGETIPGFFIKYTDSKPYLNLQGQEIMAPPNDAFRRIRLTSEINCRNMGLE